MMTPEETIRWLEQIKDKYINGGDEEFDRLRREALDSAIEAVRRTALPMCVIKTKPDVAMKIKNQLKNVNSLITTLDDMEITPLYREDEVISIKDKPIKYHGKGYLLYNWDWLMEGYHLDNEISLLRSLRAEKEIKESQGGKS